MPSSSKHHRGTSDSDANGGVRAAKAPKGDFDTTSQPRNSSSPATFWDLPLELRSVVLDLACQRRYKQGNEADTPSSGKDRLRLDEKTIWSLALVSRSFNAAFTKALYSHVKLKRPSELANFRQALVLKPSNGLLVKSIHIGPLSDLPKSWWPLRCQQLDDGPFDEESQSDEAEVSVLVKTSLTRSDPTRPRWCKPGKEWAYELPARTCYGRAVSDAIRVALEAIGVGLHSPNATGPRFLDARGNPLGINEWTVRVYEVQAALDLYLGEMRRIEDAEQRQVPSWRSKDPRPGYKAPSPCRAGKCGHYPRLDLQGFQGAVSRASKNLAVEGSSGTPPNDAGEATKGRERFMVTRKQVTTHLEKPNSHTDHYDHPLLFARGNQRKLSVDGKNRVIVVHTNYTQQYAHYSGHDSDVYNSEVEERYLHYNDDNLSTSESSSSAVSVGSSSSSASSTPSTVHEPESFTWIRRDDAVTLARSVLRLSPKVQNLSLTGYLYRCLKHNQPELAVLHCLSMGPNAPQTSCPSCLTSVELDVMEKLRVCGNGLGLWAAEAVGSNEGPWPALREIQWDYGALYQFTRRDKAIGLLFEEVDLLHGRPRSPRGQPSPPDDADGATAAKAPKEAASQTPISASSNDRYIEVRQHPHHVAAMLKKASATQREAWINGTHVPDAPHRVRLVESRAAKGSPEDDEESTDQDLDVLRKGSMQWWEEEAWELDRGEELANVSI